MLGGLAVRAVAGGADAAEPPARAALAVIDDRGVAGGDRDDVAVAVDDASGDLFGEVLSELESDAGTLVVGEGDEAGDAAAILEAEELEERAEGYRSAVVGGEVALGAFVERGVEVMVRMEEGPSRTVAAKDFKFELPSRKRPPCQSLRRHVQDEARL